MGLNKSHPVGHLESPAHIESHRVVYMYIQGTHVVPSHNTLVPLRCPAHLKGPQKICLQAGPHDNSSSTPYFFFLFPSASLKAGNNPACGRLTSYLLASPYYKPYYQPLTTDQLPYTYSPIGPPIPFYHHSLPSREKGRPTGCQVQQYIPREKEREREVVRSLSSSDNRQSVNQSTYRTERTIE